MVTRYLMIFKSSIPFVATSVLIFATNPKYLSVRILYHPKAGGAEKSLQTWYLVGKNFASPDVDFVAWRKIVQKYAEVCIPKIFNDPFDYARPWCRRDNVWSSTTWWRNLKKKHWLGSLRNRVIRVRLGKCLVRLGHTCLTHLSKWLAKLSQLGGGDKQLFIKIFILMPTCETPWSFFLWVSSEDH